MIIGTVNAQCEIVVRLAIHDAAGVEVPFEAVVDTGFNGSLTLPPALITSLGLPWRSRIRTTLGDGRDVETDIHTGTLVWDGIPRPIFVQSADTNPLVGTRLLQGHDLRARIEPGGRVEIEEIP